MEKNAEKRKNVTKIKNVKNVFLVLHLWCELGITRSL